MLLLCALRMRQRVHQRNVGRLRDGGDLRKEAWEEEEEEEGEMAGHRRWGGVLRGWCHGADLSSNCQAGPLGYSWVKEGTSVYYTHLQRKTRHFEIFRLSSFSLNFQCLEAFRSQSRKKED